ncbi:hypothetical protein TCSYLVIO_009881, partial [Trypanosoma cruzi]
PPPPPLSLCPLAATAKSQMLHNSICLLTTNLRTWRYITNNSFETLRLCRTSWRRCLQTAQTSMKRWMSLLVTETSLLAQ